MTDLGDQLRARIEREGPISVADYMDLCLHDPRCGYYATRPALGEEGDFITAPLVSQLFGEMLGIFLVHAWQKHGGPETVRKGIGQLLERTGADELMIVSDLFDPAERLRSFEIIADVAGIAGAGRSLSGGGAGQEERT